MHDTTTPLRIALYGRSPRRELFTVTSDAPPGTRSFSSFSAALEEIHDARVFGGIHWRTACRVGSAMGEAVAKYVASHAMRDRHGDHDDRR